MKKVRVGDVFITFLYLFGAIFCGIRYATTNQIHWVLFTGIFMGYCNMYLCHIHKKLYPLNQMKV